MRRRHAAASLSVSALVGGALLWVGLPAGSAGAAALPSECVADPASPAVVTCSYTSVGEHEFSVPAGISSVTVDAVGAAGGFSNLAGAPGAGAEVKATVGLPAGADTLFVEVGGVGGPTNWVGAGVGGFNGGGGLPEGSRGVASGGGGASDVRTTSIAVVSDDALTAANDTRLVVAGGGGGAGITNPDALKNGGSAGDDAVIGAGAGGDVDCTGRNGCQGASSGAPAGLDGTAGGAAGAVVGTNGVFVASGQSGARGHGGASVVPDAFPYSGGGGGGGWFGGGSGAAGEGVAGGGGAGSSHWPADATGTSMTAASGPASVTITYTRLGGATTGAATPPAATPGQSLSDTATVTASPSPGAGTPTGTVDFALFDNANCSGAPLFTDTGNPLTAAGTATPAHGYTPTANGTYYWVARYSGDATYAPSATTCADATQTVTVAVPAPTSSAGSTSPPPASSTPPATTAPVAPTTSGPTPTGAGTAPLASTGSPVRGWAAAGLALLLAGAGLLLAGLRRHPRRHHG